MNQALLASDRQDWNTPSNVLDAVRQVSKTGEIGLDPCSNRQSEVQPRVAFDIDDDGLTKSWCNHGLVYCNPPYSREVGKWIAKAEIEAANGAEIVMLIAARPDTKAWQKIIFPTAQAICFWAGRLTFLGAPNPAPFPSAVIWWGWRTDVFARVFSAHGAIVFPESD